MRFTHAAATLSLAAFVAACSGGGDKAVQKAQVGDRQVTLSTASGALSNGQNDLTVAFTDASGQPAEVQAPAVRFTMPAMGAMAAMAADAHLSPAGQPGVYKGTVTLDMKGTWQSVISYQDATGSHRVTFDVQAQ